MGVKRVIKKAKQLDESITDVFEIYIEEKSAVNLSLASLKSMRDSFNKWYDYISSHEEYSTNIKDVTDKYVFSFMNHCRNEEMKPTSINHYLRDIRAFLRWCMEHKYFESFKVPMVKEDEVIKATYSHEEMAKLLERPYRDASYAEWRTWAIINWIYATGNRASTVCEIKLGDIDYNKMEIHIRKTKTHNAMILPLSRALLPVLTDFVKMWRADAGDEDYLFASISDVPLTVNALQHAIIKYNKARGVDKTSVHAFRHTFAKEWIRNTGDVFRLQKMLGHKTLEMTRRYVNMFSEDLKENFDEYNPLDKFKKSSSRTQVIKRTDR